MIMTGMTGEEHMTREELRNTLFELADAGYKEFNDKLVPGTGATIGVRIPKVRETARKAAKGEFRRLLTELLEAPEDSLYQEERMTVGMIIGYAAMDFEERTEWLDRYIPRINSWAVCDCGNSTMKFFLKEQERGFAYVCGWLKSRKEYELRFAVVTLMEYFTNETYIDRLLEIYAGIRHEGYYVKMAAAWAVSVCYVKFPEKTLALLKKESEETGGLEDWTHNKAIQKIRESRRVPEGEKEMLNRLKRKLQREGRGNM